MNTTQRTTYVPEQRSAGDFPALKRAGVIAAGQKLKAGAVLGMITAGGQYKLSASAATDGSQTPVVILDVDIDTTDGAAPAPLQITGEVLGSKLTLGAGHTIATVTAALRPLSLFVR